MSGSNHQQISAMQQNAQMRAAFTANSMFVRKTLPEVKITSGNSDYSIALNNQGALVGIDLEITLDISCPGATAANPRVGAPYSFLKNINFVDQQNVTRHNLSGRGMFDYLSKRNGLPYDSAVTLGEGGGNVPLIGDPSAPQVAAGGTATVTFLLHVPISKSRQNTVGMVLLQTGNNNQPARLNLTLTNLLGGGGDSPYDQPITITGGSIVPHQLYWQPQKGAVAPPIDTQVQWVLAETGGDSSNLTVGMLKQVLFQTQFPTALIGIRYYNGSGFAANGTDMTSVLTKTLGGTFTIDDDSPAMRFRRYRIQHGYDCAPGLYWFDYSNAPIQFDAVGVYEADFVPATVNAGAYLTTLYDWTKIPSQLSQVPGVSQIG